MRKTPSRLTPCERRRQPAVTLRLFPKVSQAILYGSCAKGSYRPSSDIDLTLKGNELSYQDLLNIELTLDDLLMPYKIDLPCITNSTIRS